MSASRRCRCSGGPLMGNCGVFESDHDGIAVLAGQILMPTSNGRHRNRKGETLFIDARKMGVLLLGHLSSIEFINYVDGASTGTKMPRTNWKDMARYDIAVPASEFGRSYTDLLAPMIDLSRSNIIQSRTLATVRGALLPKLLSGEVRVGEAERIVEEVA